MQIKRWVTTLCLLACACQHAHPQLRQRPFTVRDSIEMVIFSDPYTKSPKSDCQLSPDGRAFLFATTQGQFEQNRVVSKIWVLDAATVAAYAAGTSATKPVPHEVFRTEGDPAALRTNSYGSLVSNVRWSADSSSILFLLEGKDSLHRLFRVSLNTRRIEQMTSGKENIENYSAVGETLVYSTTLPKLENREDALSLATRGSARRLTGQSLTDILHPEIHANPGSLAVPRDLWMQKANGTPVLLNQFSEGEQWHLPSALSTEFRPALSPHGDAVIAALPVKRIADAWRGYRFASDLYRFEKLANQPDPSGTVWSWPWQYVYIDLRTRLAYPLVAAPSAMQAAYYDPFLASWAKDGKRVLFTNSFLPLDSGSRDSDLPCAAAVFTVAKRETSCVARARFPTQNMHLVSAGFSDSSQEVVLRWSDSGRVTSESYREQDGTWRLEPSTGRSSQQSTVSLSLQQDLNRPPALWATDPLSGQSREIWDPNPQLASVALGEASIYNWTDTTGYRWSAGLVKPPHYSSGKRYPLVIQTHGFNPHEFLVDGSFTSGFAAQALASAGFMVIQMGDRADRHVLPAPQEAEVMVTAFSDLIGAMNEDALIDPKRVGAIGFSRTSWYVETALIRHPEMFRAATLVDGVDQSYMSYLLFCPQFHECQTDHEAVNSGAPFGPGRESWLRTAPGFQLETIKTPLRIEAIGPMSLLGEWEIYASLVLLRKPVDLIYLPEGQHILQRPMERWASQQGNVDWFIRWLKP